ncbi:hypothetical protein HMPREF0670_02897 [Prevotella sp. oral taxon 317 str. F0108]|nr:hypothetical protein HMPREF0670_02897 [Prevotella sp. oral taxon 317 str. F0108]
MSCSIPEVGRSVISSHRCANGNEPCKRKRLGKAFQVGRHSGVEDSFRTGSETYYGQFRRRVGTPCNRARQAEREQSQSSLGAILRQRGKRRNVQTFFISLGARYKRIRKRPRGVPSPQLYEYKVEKLQELDRQAYEGRIRLYYADESHTCTEGYVPYGWQL